jgi:hypothetical protein
MVTTIDEEELSPGYPSRSASNMKVYEAPGDNTRGVIARENRFVVPDEKDLEMGTREIFCNVAVSTLSLLHIPDAV